MGGDPLKAADDVHVLAMGNIEVLPTGGVGGAVLALDADANRPFTGRSGVSGGIVGGIGDGRIHYRETLRVLR